MTTEDQRIGITLTRAGGDWRATATDQTPPSIARVLAEAGGSGPGEVLEVIGQELDRREARRMTAELAATPATDDDRRLYGDVATVLEVLELHPDEPDLSTLELVDLSGLDGRATVAALEQAEIDGVVVRTPAGRWRLTREAADVDEGSR